MSKQNAFVFAAKNTSTAKIANMKSFTLSFMVELGLLLGTAAHAQTPTPYPPLNDGKSVTLPETHFKFTDTKIRGVDGTTQLTVSDAFGNGFTGQHGTFVHFDAGFVSQLHSHTYDYYGIVIKGTIQNYEVGVKPVNLKAGSSWYQIGKKAHSTSCIG